MGSFAIPPLARWGFGAVAAKHKAENRARPGPGSIPWPEPRPLPWPGSGQGAHWSDWWRAQFGSPARIREWAAQELTTGRLLPWFAVAYGAGVILYFTAEREPALWAAAVPAAACALGATLLRRQIVPHVIALGLFGIALGFAVATLKTALINHPVLRFAASGVTVAGFVELREESQHTDRFVLRLDRIDGGRIEEPPRRVRLSVKRGMAPPAGSFVEVKASLEPPLQPLDPAATISHVICSFRALARAKRVPLLSENPARPSLLIARAMRPHVRRTSKRISRSSTHCPATPAHSRESGNPKLAPGFFEVLCPRLRGDGRQGARV